MVAVPLAKRLGLGSALGYLLAGVMIGPFVLGFVGENSQDVLHFAEFGVVMMLFLIGLELNSALLWRMRVSILGLGGAQLVLTTAVIGLIAYGLGQPWQTSLAIGLMLSLSSTAMVLQTLDEKGWMKSRAGKGGFSVLLFQDIAVIPILAVLPFLAITAVPEVGLEAAEPEILASWLAGIKIVAVVVGIVVGGHYLTRPVFQWIASSRSTEIFSAAALLLVIGTSLAMEYIHLSPALGAFLAGVVLADSEYRHELEADIEPFKGLLLGLFFISVGASIDFSLVASEPVTIIVLVLLLIAVKFPVLLLLGKLFGLRLADNLMFAFILAQGGEFAFLLFSFATENAVLGADLANLLIVVVALSMMLTPLMVMFYERWVEPRFAEMASPRADDEIDSGGSLVILAGYGRFGQIISRMLMAGGIETTLLDHNANQVELTGRFGYKVFYGDANRVDLLKAAGAERAKLLIVAFSDREKSVELVQTLRKNFPDLKVLARAYNRGHAYDLMEAQADVVIRETFGSALMMGEEALKMLGSTDERARRIMTLFREHDETGLKKMYELWGDDVEYGLRVRRELKELEKVLQDDIDDAVEDVVEDMEEPAPQQTN